MRALLPIIQRRAQAGRYVLTNKGRHSKELQKTLGDVLVNSAKLGGDLIALEIKCEARNAHGNLFLEEWSNRKWGTRGWMHTLDADVLWYYFIDTRELVEVPLAPLREYMEQHGRSYPLKRQSKYNQLNDTWGRCVPITDILKHVSGSVRHEISL